MSAIRLSGRSYRSLTVAGYPPFKMAPTAAAGLFSGSVARSRLRSLTKPAKNPLLLAGKSAIASAVSSDSSGWLALRQILKDRRGLGRTDARQEQEHSPPRGLVARVDDDPQMREHVLDVGLLEKSQAAANRVGDASRQKLALQENAVVMIAIEHGHLAQRQALFRELRVICWQMNAASW